MTHADLSAAHVTAIDASMPGVGDIISDLLDAIRNNTKQPGADRTAATALEDRYGVGINLNANTTTDDLSTVGDVARIIAQALANEARAS